MRLLNSVHVEWSAYCHACIKPGYNGASRVCNVEAAGVLKQNQWLTLVVRYDAAEGSVRLLVNGIEAASASCSEPLADRSVANTLVGKSNWPGDPSFNGDMAGVLVSDRSLSGDEIQWAAAAIGLGHDPVCGYRSERLHGWQVRVGNNGWAPNKNPPCVHAASEPMTPIALNAPGASRSPVPTCPTLSTCLALRPPLHSPSFYTGSTCPPAPPSSLRAEADTDCCDGAGGGGTTRRKSDMLCARRRRIPRS